MTIVRLWFVLSFALAAAGFVACRDLARAPDASWWWAWAQWGNVLAALGNAWVLYIMSGEDEDEEQG